MKTDQIVHDVLNHCSAMLVRRSLGWLGHAAAKQALDLRVNLEKKIIST